MKRMKLSMLVAMFFVCMMINSALAVGPPEYAGAQPTGGEGNRVVIIPDLPEGTLLNFVVFNDCKGTAPKYLGVVRSVTLKKCDSFNFIWKDKQGESHWQMITPHTKTGSDLRSIWHPDGCKYGFKDADVNR